MGLLSPLGKLLGREVQGLGNAYHGLNPFDKEGWHSRPTSPLFPVHQSPLAPSSNPVLRRLPVQGSIGGLQVGAFAPGMRIPPQPTGFIPDRAGALYAHPGQYGTGYNLLTGSRYFSPTITPRAQLNMPNFPFMQRVE